MKQLVLLIATAISASAIAQSPTLASSSAPQIGDIFIMQAAHVSGINTSNSGPNQIWDYSAVTDSGSSYSESVISPTATPYAASYPGATIALTSHSFTDTAYAYEKVTGSRMTYLGNYIGVAGFVYYTTPRVIFQYPLTYGDSYANPFAANTTNGDTITGVDSVLADGYGTLKLPSHTYTNVLRLKYIQHYHSVNSGFYEDIYQLEYSYYIPGFHNFLFDIAYTVNNVNGTAFSATNAQYSVAVTTGVEELKEENIVTIYPNPSHGQVSISVGEAMAGADMTISDLSGRTISKTSLKTGNQQIDISSATKGLYIVTIKSGQTSVSRKLIID